MKPNYQAINANREKARRRAAAHRISEVARIATQYQQQGVATRTEALRLAERIVP
jgi:hypothetical protein